MRSLYLYILLNIILTVSLLGQTTFVPDSNLRTVLKLYYGSYLDANDYVVNAKAATYTSFMNCSNQNVKDLTGAWKFTKMNSLVCHTNSISNFDSLINLTELQSIYCYHNKITQIPALTSLTKLSYLSCGYNQLTSFPDLSANTPLTYLDCGANTISKLTGVEKLINLQSLYVYDNKFDSLPDLSNLTKLQLLMCQKNNLKTIKGLDNLSQLTYFSASNNQIDSLPDLSLLTKMNTLSLYNNKLTKMPNVSTMTSLKQLFLNNNNLSFVPDFSTNTNLSTVDLSQNKISKFPDLSASSSKLKILKISNNLLDSIPDLSQFSVLDTLFVQNNRLTFEDVIPLVQNSIIVNLKYAPQEQVGYGQNANVTELQPFTIDLGIDKNVSGNQYVWLKNGVTYSVTSSGVLIIPQVQMADSGVYVCQITNPLAPNLILTSRPVILTVKPCINISNLTYTVTDYDCNLGGSVTINNQSISGGQTPYVYTLTSNEFGIVKYANGNQFTNLFENEYTLEIKDKFGCKIKYNNPIPLKGKKGADCKNLVIINEDNSPNKELFIEEKGTAKIYNSDGQLVITLETPKVWDGKNQNGLFIPGYYVIELNGKTSNITLIK